MNLIWYMKKEFSKFLNHSVWFVMVVQFFYLVSCATSGTGSVEIASADSPKAGGNTDKVSASASSFASSDKVTTASPEQKSEAKHSGNTLLESAFTQMRHGVAFTLPDSSYEFTSDSRADSEAPIEFYKIDGGFRGTLSVTPFHAEDLNETARLELQAKRRAGEKVLYAELALVERFRAAGILWETGGERDSVSVRACGFVAEANGLLYKVSLAADSAYSRETLLQEFDKAFVNLQIESSRTAAASSELSAESVQRYESKQLGYVWKTSDTLWHFWNGVSAQNADPDLVLSDKNEEVTLFIYGALVSEDEVSERDLFKVLLRRLGIFGNTENIQQEHKKEAGRSVRHFTISRRVEGYDFTYKGKFIYESGRGILIAGWSQGVLAKKYAAVLNRALQGLVLETSPSESGNEKTNAFNAAVLNEVGMLRLEEDQPLVALSYFERANKADPTEALYLINCGFVYQLKELYGPGISHFLSQIELVQTNAKLLSILGEMYESVYDFANERKYMEAALQKNPNEPEYVINLSDALWGLGQRTQSLEIVRRLYEKQPSSRLGVYVAKTYMGLDQYAEAVEVLYNARDKFGISRELGKTLTEALLFLGRYNEALSVCEETLAHQGKNNADILLLQGKILFHLKNYRQAEKVLEKVVKISADNEDAKSFLSATRAFLGKADNKALRTPIKPVEARRALSALYKKENAARAKQEGFPAVVHFYREALSAPPKEDWIHTEESLTEILDSRGAALFQEFTYPFLPGYDRIYLNALEVYDSTLTLKYNVPISNAYITYATESGESNESQTAHFPLPKLTPGDLIYLQISRTGIANRGVIPYMEYKTGKEIPVAQTSFCVYADTARYAAEEYGPLEREDISDKKREWKMENPIIIRNEIYMPEYRDFGAGVLLAGKREWAAVGEDYENLIRHQYKNAISVREKAFEVRGNALGKEAILSIIHFVRQNIRYRDVRFGGHSLIPQTAEKTLKDYRGDCKDQVLLLKEMLQTIGIKSYLAAVPLVGNGYANLPTIQQFNHVILYIPKTESTPEMWVDPTDKAGNDRPVPLDMEGKTAFIIDGKNSRIVTTPILEDNQEHKAYFFHRLHLSQNGNAEFRDSVLLEGKFASALRNIFYGKDLKEQEKLLENLLRNYIPDVSLSQIRLENLSAFDKPFILVATFGSKRYFGQNAEGGIGRYPNVWESSMLKLPKVNKRFLPIRIPHETHFESHLTVSADAPLQAQVVYPQMPESPEYVSFEKLADGIRFTTFALYADPSEYESIRKDWTAVLSATAPNIQFK